MQACEEDPQSSEPLPCDLFSSGGAAPPQVRLPIIMHAARGNAFAQMKEREKEKSLKEKQIQSADSSSPSSKVKRMPSHRSSPSRFEDVVALPRQPVGMGGTTPRKGPVPAVPMSRYAAPCPPSPTPHPPESRVSAVPPSSRNDKKDDEDASPSPAFIDEKGERPPPVPEKDDIHIHNNNSTNVTKRSRVATLASKFSLKDIGKEYHRKDPVVESVPMPRPKVRVSTESDDNNKSHEQETLHISQSKNNQGATHPLSAPAGHQHSFRGFCQSLSLGQEMHVCTVPSSSVCSSSMVSYGKDVEGQAKAATGQKSSQGNSEVASGNEQSQISVASNNTDTVAQNHSSQRHDRDAKLFSSASSEAHRPGTAVSDNGQQQSTRGRSENSPTKDSDSNDNGLLIVSINKRSEGSATNENRRSVALIPTAPIFTPSTTTSHGHATAQTQVDIPIHLGVTTHGGYAPPPPHPNYQNVLSLGQQLSSHADNIHHHLGSVVNRVAKIFTDTNNWSTDQILRQVDNMVDLCGLLNSRSAVQAEVSNQLQLLVGEIRVQIESLRHETQMMEERLSESFKREIGKVKAELARLSPTDLEVAHADLQAPSASTTRVTEENNNTNNNSKRRAMKMKRQNTPTTKGKQPAGQSSDQIQATSAAASRSGTPFSKRTDEQTSSSETVPTPTAAFRTPPIFEEETGEEGKKTNGQIKARPRRGPLNPGEESSGSPTPRAAKVDETSRLLDAALTASPSSSNPHGPKGQKGESNENRNSGGSDVVKTPKRKGVFSFRRKREGENNSSRFLRTPRRDKEAEAHTKNAEQHSHSHQATSSAETTPPVPALPAIAGQSESTPRNNNDEEESPSNIHPALRNPQQRQQMRERERQRQYQRHGLPSRPLSPSPNSNQPHGNPLKQSQSHHGFAYRPPIYNQATGNPLYAYTGQNPNMHTMMLYGPPGPPPPPPPPPPAFMPPHHHHSSSGNFGPVPSGPLPHSPSHYHQRFNASGPGPGPGPAPWMSHAHSHSGPTPSHMQYHPPSEWNGNSPNWNNSSGNNQNRN